MASFEINLIRNQILSPARRRLLFWCMLGYLLSCALAMGVVAYHAEQHVMGATEAKAETARLEADFEQHNPGEGGVARSRQTAEDRLQARAVRLEIVNGILGRRLALARLMVELLAPLPLEVTINALDLDRGKGEMSFSLSVPNEDGRPGLSASQIMQTWKENPALTAQLREFQAVGTQRRMVDGKSVLILKYSCQPIVKGP